MQLLISCPNQKQPEQDVFSGCWAHEKEGGQLVKNAQNLANNQGICPTSLSASVLAFCSSPSTSLKHVSTAPCKWSRSAVDPKTSHRPGHVAEVAGPTGSRNSHAKLPLCLWGYNLRRMMLAFCGLVSVFVVSGFVVSWFVGAGSCVVVLGCVSGD